MSLLDALLLALAALLAGYYIGIGRRESGNTDLEKINSAIERLTKELCGDYQAVEGAALDRVASAAEGIARNLYDLRKVLDASKRSS